MSKTLKMSILLIITLGFLFLSQTEVSAVDIDSTATLEETFNGTSATISESTVTLNGDVTIDDVIEIVDGEYVLDLNGYTLTVGEFYVVDGKLTINDAEGKGKLVSGCTAIGSEDELKGELVINNGNYEVISNNGKLTINNGTINTIYNLGTLTIEDGTFYRLSQAGTATINGGKFIAQKVVIEGEEPFDAPSDFSLECKTTITGGEFTTGEDVKTALKLISSSNVSENSINQIVGEGFEANYDSNEFSSDSNTAYYGTVKIVKDRAEEIFNKIAPNGVWTVNSYKPTNPMDGQSLLTALIKDCVDSNIVKEAYAWYDTVPEEATINLVLVGSSNSKVRNVKVVYNEPDTNSNTKVNEVLGKMKKLNLDDIDEKTSYRVEDLYLINYLDASTKGLDGSMALNFSKELIEAANGSNISFRFIGGFGGGNPNGLYTYVGGQAIVYFGDTAYATINAGVNANHLLYIPSDTANTSEAYIEAAMKRIKNYLGTTEGITIEVGGTFESLNEYDKYADRIITWNENGFIDETTSGSNYYNLTINGKTYKFAICKKDASELETPKYIGSDIKSNISITSDATEIPLDTALTVKKVSSANIEKALSTSVYAAYDISLYSNAKQVSITKLENGKFIVNIPVPEILKDKEITVYYINSNEEKEEHIATVKDGIASFETDHFSTYVLAEVENDKDNNIGDNNASDNSTGNTIGNNNTESSDNKNTNIGNINTDNNGNNGNNPQTGDNILFFVEMLLIAVIGIITTTKFTKYCKTK